MHTRHVIYGNMMSRLFYSRDGFFLEGRLIWQQQHLQAKN